MQGLFTTNRLWQDGQIATPTAQRCVIGDSNIELEHIDDRSRQAFGLTQRLVEHQAKYETRLDGCRRIDRLTAALAGSRRRPCPSGAGKTTLCSLLPRFYDIDEGRITIDGIDVRDMTLASLRRQIGVVQQDVFLFGGTVRDNIAYGRLDTTDAEIRGAAWRARMAATIARMPDGFATVVGERGIKLSGGQKQRLAIARMFLKNPRVLILNEATSALDTETECAIQQSLAELAAGRTTRVIAHRSATIRDADRIVVVDEHGVVEQGRHNDLLAAGDHYRRLHDAQFGA